VKTLFILTVVLLSSVANAKVVCTSLCFSNNKGPELSTAIAVGDSEKEAIEKLQAKCQQNQSFASAKIVVSAEEKTSNFIEIVYHSSLDSAASCETL
jgi:hypothetical protein